MFEVNSPLEPDRFERGRASQEGSRVCRSLKPQQRKTPTFNVKFCAHQDGAHKVSKQLWEVCKAGKAGEKGSTEGLLELHKHMGQNDARAHRCLYN